MIRQRSLISVLVLLPWLQACSQGSGTYVPPTPAPTAATPGLPVAGGATSGPIGTGASGVTTPSGNGGSGGAVATTTPVPPAEHALGTITLAESHAPAGTPSPLVSAAFRPNTISGAATACQNVVGACKVSKLPNCGTCKEHEGCSFDATCTAKCQRLCDLTCAQGEECYFAYEGAPACRKRESFDAGSISLVGGPSPITVFPPYSFVGTPGVAPYLPKATMRAVASGAAAAGFKAFDRPFDTTTFVQSSPPLSQIPISDAYGTGALPISWVPGNGELTLRGVVTNAKAQVGTFECPLNDPSGKGTVERAVINAAANNQAVSGLTLSLERRNRTIHKDLATTGQLATQKVESVGWLEVVTQSTETQTIKGCTTPEVPCGSTCKNLKEDVTNCGACGKACSAGMVCENSVCVIECGSLTACSGKCVNTESDSANCGACGKICGAPSLCRSGTCSCPVSSDTLCGSTCTNTLIDMTNCGVCGNACPVGATCRSGTCACPGAKDICGTNCVDRLNDVTNCGTCGKACKTGEICDYGQCV